MTFKDLNLIEPIMRSISEKGYVEPSPIQAEAIPHILNGYDLLGCAQTGTGKTAAFSIPIIQNLCNSNSHRKSGIKALIITPTRELAIQIGECFADYAVHTPLRHTVIFGGVNQNPQIDAIRSKVDILIATPGRLLDLIDQGHIKLHNLEYFVLDEADRMLDMGFIHDIKRILKHLPSRRQSLFFSATMPPQIEKLANSILTNPRKVEVTPVSSTVDKIDQYIHFVDKKDKPSLLVELLSDKELESVLVFTRTKYGADKVARTLNKHSLSSAAIHGNKSQNSRQKALNDFKERNIRILIATDIAARGIDVDHLSHVINYELPDVPETYVHRIGRTGRAGRDGVAISFCDAEEGEMLRDIQKLIGKKIIVAGGKPHDSKAIKEAAQRKKEAHEEKIKRIREMKKAKAAVDEKKSKKQGVSKNSNRCGGSAAVGDGERKKKKVKRDVKSRR